MRVKMYRNSYIFEVYCINNIFEVEFKKIKIYIVDDSQDYREMLRAILRIPELERYDILEAGSGNKILEILGINGEGEEVDDIGIILMDISMPKVSGIEAIQKIKSKKKYKDVPIIMVTANTDTKSLEAAFEAGAIDYIKKPFKKLELLTRVRSAIRLKRETDKRKSREKKLITLAKDLEETNWKLKKLTYLDGMTGISNRRYFDEYLGRSWRYGVREKKTLSLVLVDIDFFRPFNDKYGILAGDDCITAVAKALEKVATRPNDLVARYSGEEFSLILPDTAIEPALVLAEEARKAIENLKISHAISTISKFVTISVGVASMVPQKNETSYKIFKDADKVMFKAKQNGRNRVESIEITVADK